MNKKNILIIRNAEFKYNASMKRIYTALKSSYNVSILERIRNVDENNEQSDRRDIYSLNIPSTTGGGMKNIFNLLSYNYQVMRYLLKNRKKIDIIHAFDFDTAFISCLFSRLFNKKIVYHIADFYTDSRYFPNKLKQLVKKLDFWTINKADITIVCTEERKEQIRGSFPRKLRVIHNIPVLEEKTLHLKKYKYRKIFCYIGTLSEERFLKEMLEFFAGNEDYTLNIGGYGKDELLVREYAKKYKNIVFLGKLRYEDTFIHYSESDFILAIYNSNNKNNRYAAPNKFYESYVLGKPIIVAKDTGIDKYVERYKTGLITEYNYESFKLLVGSIDENRYEELCNSFSNATFSNEENMKKIREIYLELYE